MTDRALLNRLAHGPLSADSLTFEEWQSCVRMENRGVLVRVSEEPAVWIVKKANAPRCVHEEVSDVLLR